MKKIILFIALNSIVLAGNKAQTATSNAYPKRIVEIRLTEDKPGLKFGYTYNLQQARAALGEPAFYNIHPNDFYGNNYYLDYQTDGRSDLTLMFDDDPREDKGLYAILVSSPKFTLHIGTTVLKVGDSVDKIKQMPQFSYFTNGDAGQAVIFNNYILDQCLNVVIKNDKIISINYEDRIY